MARPSARQHCEHDRVDGRAQLATDGRYAAPQCAQAENSRASKETRHGCPHQPLPRGLRAQPARPAGLLGRGRAGDRLDRAGPRRCSIPRWASTAAGSSAASATPAGTRSTAMCRPGAASSRRSSTIRRSPARSRRSPTTRLQTETQVLAGILRDLGVEQGRPRHPLHADGAGGGDRDARLRAHRRDPFGGVRRLRRQGARDPHRRLQAEGDPVGKLRHRARPHRPVQAAARRGDRAVVAQAGRLPDPATAAGRGHAGRRPRSRLGGGARPRAGLGEVAVGLRAGSPPPIRSTSSTRRARPAGRRAWCATMAATWSRSNGR